MINIDSFAFTGIDGCQSMLRSPDSSDPQLMRHATSGETAGMGIRALPSSKEEKTSREFKDGALISCQATGPSLLDLITNNRHIDTPEVFARPVGRGKFCGRITIKGIGAKTNRVVYRRVNCGSWTCSYCGPRKATNARLAIRRVAEDLKLRYFLTLTLDPKHLKKGESAVRHLRRVFNKFREYLRRKYDTPPHYICVKEFTQSENPHLHILFDRFIEHVWISKTWNKLGGGKIVFIKQVTVRNVARYLSKYLTKELLLSAPKGTRRITTARSIKVFPKFNSGITWQLIRESIWRILMKLHMAMFTSQFDLFHLLSMQFDEEKFLKSFEIVEDA